MIFLHRGVRPWAGAPPGAPTPTRPEMAAFSPSGSTPAAWSTRAATPLPSRVRPSSRCSLPT